MKKITLFISALCLIGSGIIAQNGKNGVIFNSKQLGNNSPTATTRTCATMDMVSQEDLEAFEDFLAPKIAAYMAAKANGGSPEAVYTIPTVVHVIHNSSEAVGVGRNIPNIRIQEQMTVLNDDFRRTNSDADGTWAQAADCEINFCLITKYPSGHPQAGQAMPEPGVDRVDATTIGVGNTTSGYSTGVIDGTIKPATSWDPTEVMNIWVCQLQGGLLGYAQFPNSGAANTDGTVMGYQYFGLTGGAFGLGRTTTHEVGHWLGCYHIWGDDGNACSGSDLCNDTPNQAGATSGCPSGVQTDACASSSPGYMYQNYMDYSNDACMNLFTQDQKARMQNVMATAVRRSTLNASSLILCTPTALDAEFTASATTIVAGNTVTFTDASTGPDPITNWAWDFDVTSVGGVSPGTGNTQGPHVVTYNNPGTFTVSLQVTDNQAATDTETKTAYITVLPVGSTICDSTVAGWDWTTEAYGAAYWGPDCNGSSPSGLIMGNNCYDDNGWAHKVSFSQTGKELTDVIYVFVQSIGSQAANLKVWDDDGAGSAPNTVMYSQATTTGAFSANLNQFVGMSVTPAVALNGDFYIGYDHAALPSTGDTLCMGVANGTSGNTTWANEVGGWLDLSTYGVNYKGTVIAVVCDISTGEKELIGELNEVAVYPNPSVGTINIALTQKANSTVTVLNVLGEEIFNSTKNTQLFTVDMNNQPNGVYFVNIKTGNSVTTKKIILSK